MVYDFNYKMPLVNAPYGYFNYRSFDSTPLRRWLSRSFFSPRQNALLSLISYFVLEPSTDPVLPVHTGYEMKLVKIHVFPAEKPLVFFNSGSVGTAIANEVSVILTNLIPGPVIRPNCSRQTWGQRQPVSGSFHRSRTQTTRCPCPPVSENCPDPTPRRSDPQSKLVSLVALPFVNYFSGKLRLVSSSDYPSGSNNLSLVL